MTLNIEAFPVEDSNLDLSERLEEGVPGAGEPKQVRLENTGDENISKITVNTGGAGSGFVQLAVDNKNEPGVWAAPGEAIVLVPKSNVLRPGSSIKYWSRPIFDIEDMSKRLGFDYGFEIEAAV